MTHRGAAFSFLLALSVVLLGSVPSRAAAPAWTLVNARFESSQVSLDSIDAAGIHLSAEAGAQPVIVAWEDVLELSHAVDQAQPAAAAFDLYLTGGDRLHGRPMGVDGDNLKWNSPALGDIPIPMTRVAAIGKSGKPIEGLDDNRKEDLVRLANGDATHGIVTQIDASGVTIQAGGASPTLSFDNVTAVLLASTSTGSGSHKPMYRVRFSDGTSISVPSVTMTGGRIAIHFDSKLQCEIDPSAIQSIEQLNGPISWLTSLTPAENVYKPYFRESFPTRFDRTVDDLTPIREKYPAFHHGIGCHSYARLSYDLDGSFAGFRTQFAIESDSPLADVTVRILLDGKVAFEKKNVKAGPVYPVAIVPLGSAKSLSLEVDYGENLATEDRFVWLDPALMRVLPPPPPIPAPVIVPPPTTLPVIEPTTQPATIEPTTQPAISAPATQPAVGDVQRIEIPPIQMEINFAVSIQPTTLPSTRP